jgi:amino acid adenylation domain-containing protein
MRLEQTLRHSASRYPDKTALVTGERRLSYAELDAASDRLAAALAAQGVGRGDRVVILADNGWEAVVSLFGAAKAGAVFSLLGAGTKAARLAYVLGNCRPAALIALARLQPIVAAALAETQAPPLRCCLVADGEPALPGALRFADALACPGGPPAHPGIDLDLAMLIYTSGSTGRPKGVMLTHRNVEAAATSVMSYLENGPEDVILDVLPIAFSYGLYQVLTAVRAGATVVLEKSFAFPQAILARLAAERVTGFPLVPTIAALLLQQRELHPGAFPHLRYLTTASAPIPPSHLERLQTLFPQARIFSMHGMTECKRCTWLPPEQLPLRPTSVGIPVPGTEAWVADETGARLGPGEVGELVVRGPHVMQGYWEDPEATARALRPGPYPWERVLHTGDLFRMDEEGFLYFVSRKDDIIKTRGEKVSPREVENVLYLLPEVREAAVIGVPDPLLGMAVKAVLVLAPGASLGEREVIRHCAARLEDFMVPKQVEFRAELPKTDSGKISRRLVAETTGAR